MKTIIKEKGLSNFAYIVLLSLVSLIFLVKNQIIVGTAVNATIFITAYFYGFKRAAIIGCFPSVFALVYGVLPISLFFMIPFIILANIILAYVFLAFKNYHFFVQAVIASLAKFVFLWITGVFILQKLLDQNLAFAINSMMSYTQLITALIGAIASYIFIKIVKLKN
ncbi:MAG: iron hydrogenase [Chlamydiae bacterium]|nr:iron hydrogenase [Chlamydiota bacterium]